MDSVSTQKEIEKRQRQERCNAVQDSPNRKRKRVKRVLPAFDEEESESGENEERSQIESSPVRQTPERKKRKTPAENTRTEKQHEDTVSLKPSKDGKRVVQHEDRSPVKTRRSPVVATKPIDVRPQVARPMNSTCVIRLLCTLGINRERASMGWGSLAAP